MIDIDYLNDYLPGIEIIQDEENYFDKIPALWSDILKSDNRKAKVIASWTSIFSNGELSNTIRFMNDHLKEIHLVKIDDIFSLMYSFEVEGEIFYRQGHNSKNNNDWDSELQLVSENLYRFYSELHDGWFEPESESMGLLTSDSISAIGSEDWGIMEEIETDKDLNKLISIFSNGGGGYLCIDFNTNPISGAIWWDDEQPDFDVNLVDVLDEWIVIGFE